MYPLSCSGAVYRDGKYTGEQCPGTVTHLDRKGYVYCESHGVSRRSQMPCRKLRPWEIRRLESGRPLSRY